MTNLLLLAIPLPLLAAVAAEDDTAATIIALERAALDRSDKGGGEGFLEISDPEVTCFDPPLARPIRGLDALRAYYHRSSASEAGSGTIINATGVYRRTRDGWRIIHTHWSYLKPELR